MKKGIIFLVLAVLIAGVVFGQEKAKNSVTGGLMLGLFSGISADYERVLLNDFLGKGQLALGVEAVFGSYLFVTSLVFADVQVKWYPWSGKFYADLGLGFGNISVLVSSAPMLVIPVGIGWKIDIGNPNGWILDIGLGLDYLAILDSDWNTDDGMPANPRVNVQLGYAW